MKFIKKYLRDLANYGLISFLIAARGMPTPIKKIIVSMLGEQFVPYENIMRTLEPETFHGEFHLSTIFTPHTIAANEQTLYVPKNIFRVPSEDNVIQLRRGFLPEFVVFWFRYSQKKIPLISPALQRHLMKKY